MRKKTPFFLSSPLSKPIPTCSIRDEIAPLSDIAFTPPDQYPYFPLCQPTLLAISKRFDKTKKMLFTRIGGSEF